MMKKVLAALAAIAFITAAGQVGHNAVYAGAAEGSGASAVFAATATGSIIKYGEAHAAYVKKSGTKDFRAVWVCSVLNLDFPSGRGLGAAELRAEIDAIVGRSVQMNMNAVVVQVRPSGDALYKSNLFPWSEYLSGTQGVAPNDGFDPLAYWVEQAHKHGLEVHAWINPYRVTHTTANITDVTSLAADNPARKEPSRVVEYKGALYYDPGLPENKKLVISGVEEIIKNYDVDGVHLDDYFYPGTDFPDDASYGRYGGGADRADWRRANVNDVIRGIRRVVSMRNKAIRFGAADRFKPIRFGVSPFAIWMNVSSSPLGSDTRGSESYKTMYADTRRWVQSGWIDYICPQIYWYRGFEVADYEKVLAWWVEVCADTNVDLYVGHAAYKEYDNAGDADWDGEIVGQLEYNARMYPDAVKGGIFFRYGNMLGDLGDSVSKLYK